MENLDYFKILDLYFGEPALKNFLDAVKITKAPKIPRDETSVIVENKTTGIEVTFDDEEFIDFPPRDYPDGALVLTGIIFNGFSSGTSAAFSSTLPKGLKFGMSREDATRLLGPPKYFDAEMDITHWNYDDKRLFIDFTDDRIESVKIQLKDQYTEG